MYHLPPEPCSHFPIETLWVLIKDWAEIPVLHRCFPLAILHTCVCVCVCVCVCCFFSHVWLCNPMDCSPPGPSVHGILQARIPDCVVVLSSRESSCPRDWTHVSCLLGRQVLYHWATVEAHFSHRSVYMSLLRTLYWRLQLDSDSSTICRISHRNHKLQG